MFRTRTASLVWRWTFLAAVCSGSASAFGADPALESLNAFLEPFRTENDFPALAAAVVVGGKVTAAGAVGVRKYGSDEPVTLDDRFHLGSCGKAMTATLLARLVEDGKLSWDTTLAEALPDLAPKMHEGFRGVTIRHLLCHRSGTPHESWPPGMTFQDVHGLPGGPREQRLAYARRILTAEPAYEPGSDFVYSNAGFAVAGVIAETALHQPWEALMQEMVFAPLEITSAGFGAMGSPGKIGQPWQHERRDDGVLPRGPEPLADNPPAIAPAGTIHMTIVDWARFVAEHVNEGKKKGRLLWAKTYKVLHKPPFGGDYAFGWAVTPRPWAGGDALTHAGSNNANFAVVWAAPKQGFAVLVATNIAGEGVPKACDEIVWNLIKKYLLDR